LGEPRLKGGPEVGATACDAEVWAGREDATNALAIEHDVVAIEDEGGG
jgi:hypothetical protein